MGYESSLMLFSVRHFVFAVEIGRLREVAQVDASSVLPEGGSAKFMYNYRGNWIPVVDLSRLLDTGMTRTSEQLQLIIMGTSENIFAIAVDAIKKVYHNNTDIFRFPEMLRTENNKFIESVFRYENRMSFVIDTEKLYDCSAVVSQNAECHAKL